MKFRSLAAIVALTLTTLVACSSKPSSRVIGRTNQWEITLVDSGYLDLPLYPTQFDRGVNGPGNFPYLTIKPDLFAQPPSTWLGLRLSTKLLDGKPLLGKADCKIEGDPCEIYLGTPQEKANNYDIVDGKSLTVMSLNTIQQGQRADLLLIIRLGNLTRVPPDKPVHITLGSSLFAVGKDGVPPIEFVLQLKRN